MRVFQTERISTKNVWFSVQISKIIYNIILTIINIMYSALKQLTNNNNNDKELDSKDEPYEKKLTEGKSYLLVRLATNKYRMTSIIENKNIYMNNILNFRIIIFIIEI
jgi:hypothetical protein